MTSSPSSQPQAPVPDPSHPSDRTSNQIADPVDLRDGRAVFPAVAAVLIRHPEQPEKFLLVRQANSDWAVLPGGKAHWDESPRSTARREAAEETGVEVEVGRLLVLNWLSGQGLPSGAYPCLMTTFAGTIRADQVDQLTVPDGELREHLWWTVEEAAQGGRLAPIVLANVHAALRAALSTDGTAYLES